MQQVWNKSSFYFIIHRVVGRWSARTMVVKVPVCLIWLTLLVTEAIVKIPLAEMYTEAKDMSKKYKKPEKMSTDPNDIKFYWQQSSKFEDDPIELTFKDGTKGSGWSEFDPARKLIMIIHGLRCSYLSPSPSILRNAFVRAGLTAEINVVLVDYGAFSGNKRFDIRKVYKKTPVIARRIADFLLSTGCELRKVHLIASSLGATVAAHVGVLLTNTSGPRIHRITGCDPAKTLGLYRDLTRQCAKIVDVIHTDSGLTGQGNTANNGHVDFWVNGGNGNQSVCRPYLANDDKGNLVIRKRNCKSAFGTANVQTPCNAVCNHGSANVYLAMTIYGYKMGQARGDKGAIDFGMYLSEDNQIVSGVYKIDIKSPDDYDAEGNLLNN